MGKVFPIYFLGDKNMSTKKVKFVPVHFAIETDSSRERILFTSTDPSLPTSLRSITFDATREDKYYYLDVSEQYIFHSLSILFYHRFKQECNASYATEQPTFYFPVFTDDDFKNKLQLTKIDEWVTDYKGTQSDAYHTFIFADLFEPSMILDQTLVEIKQSIEELFYKRTNTKPERTVRMLYFVFEHMIKINNFELFASVYPLYPSRYDAMYDFFCGMKTMESDFRKCVNNRFDLEKISKDWIGGEVYGRLAEAARKAVIDTLNKYGENIPTLDYLIVQETNIRQQRRARGILKQKYNTTDVICIPIDGDSVVEKYMVVYPIKSSKG